MFEFSELERQLHNLLRLGTIAVIDHQQHRLKVQTGELLTGWLDWPTETGRNYRRWRPLRLNSQVLIACPSGDPAQAQIIGMLYSEVAPAPSDDPELDLIRFDNGSYLQHNNKSGDMAVHAVGDLSLTANGNIRINGKRVDIN